MEVRVTVTQGSEGQTRVELRVSCRRGGGKGAGRSTEVRMSNQGGREGEERAGGVKKGVKIRASYRWVGGKGRGEGV